MGKSVVARDREQTENLMRVIKRHRGSKDMSWGALAKILGTSPQTLKKWRDHPDLLTRGTIKLIVSALDIPPEEIRPYII